MIPTVIVYLDNEKEVQKECDINIGFIKQFDKKILDLIYTEYDTIIVDQKFEVFRNIKNTSVVICSKKELLDFIELWKSK